MVKRSNRKEPVYESKRLAACAICIFTRLRFIRVIRAIRGSLKKIPKMTNELIITDAAGTLFLEK